MDRNDGTDRTRDEVRTRILSVAADLLLQGGRDALTTRAVAAAAGVQAPTLYRLFGDKRGLLDAVAEHGFATYVGEKAVREPGPDPVEDLRRGWDLHIEFGLRNPAAYSLTYGDPRLGAPTPAAAAGYRVLQAHIRRIALAGRLRISEDRAAQLVHAAGCGTVLTLLSTPEGRRDLGLSEVAREAAIAAISTLPSSVEPNPVTAAVALRAALPEMAALTEAERGLLDEWLDRLANSAPPPDPS